MLDTWRSHLAGVLGCALRTGDELRRLVDPSTRDSPATPPGGLGATAPHRYTPGASDARPTIPYPPAPTTAGDAGGTAAVPAPSERAEPTTPWTGDDLPAGPWRWRYHWPVPGRPAGMALVAADDSLVMWVPGGFADPWAPADGRPTPAVAQAIASIPDHDDDEDEGVDRAGLDEALSTAAEAEQLLRMALGAVEKEIAARTGPELRRPVGVRSEDEPGSRRPHAV